MNLVAPKKSPILCWLSSPFAYPFPEAYLGLSCLDCQRRKWRFHRRSRRKGKINQKRDGAQATSGEKSKFGDY